MTSKSGFMPSNSLRFAPGRNKWDSLSTTLKSVFSVTRPLKSLDMLEPSGSFGDFGMRRE